MKLQFTLWLTSNITGQVISIHPHEIELPAGCDLEEEIQQQKEWLFNSIQRAHDNDTIVYYGDGFFNPRHYSLCRFTHVVTELH